ncbi:MAG: hypothetical protein ABI822_04145 [Bryobacteraceae bacterium]
MYFAVTLAVFACACGKKEEPAVTAPPPRTPAGPPVALGVTPDAGSGSSETFIVKFSQPGNYRQLSNVRLLINSETSGGHACYVYYSLVPNAFLLVNDSGQGSAAAALGSGATVENSQCTVLTEGAKVEGAGSDVSVTIPIRFKAAFAGVKKLVLFAENSAGANTDLVLKGQYEVTSRAASSR